MTFWKSLKKSSKSICPNFVNCISGPEDSLHHWSSDFADVSIIDVDGTEEAQLIHSCLQMLMSVEVRFVDSAMHCVLRQNFGQFLSDWQILPIVSLFF